MRHPPSAHAFAAVHTASFGHCAVALHTPTRGFPETQHLPLWQSPSTPHDEPAPAAPTGENAARCTLWNALPSFALVNRNSSFPRASVARTLAGSAKRWRG
jgi:hypothetical protein